MTSCLLLNVYFFCLLNKFRASGNGSSRQSNAVQRYGYTEKDFSAYSKVSPENKKDAFMRHNVGVGKKHY
jgi:hypothetical protein